MNKFGKGESLLMVDKIGLSFHEARLYLINNLSEILKDYKEYKNNAIDKIRPCWHWKWVQYMMTTRTSETPDLLHYIVIPTALITPILLALVVFMFLNEHTNIYASLFFLVLACVIWFACGFNCYLYVSSQLKREWELFDSIDDVLELYKNNINVSMVVDSALNNPSNPTEMGNSSTKCDEPRLQTGHAHINIVNVYRNSFWQHVPSLMLCPGDVISLMAGDITPGAVQELCKIGNTGTWSFGKVINGGDKIVSAVKVNGSTPAATSPTPIGTGSFVNIATGSASVSAIESTRPLSAASTPNFTPPLNGTGTPGPTLSSVSVNQTCPVSVQPLASPLGHHRSIASNNLELLKYAGDMKCYVMLESPMNNYVRMLLRENRKVAVKSKGTLWWCRQWCIYVFPFLFDGVESRNCVYKIRPTDPTAVGIHPNGTTSVIHKLTERVVREGSAACCYFVIVVLLLNTMRCIVFDGLQSLWLLHVLVPIITAVLVFSPISLNFILIVLEAISTASLLAHVEAAYIRQEIEAKEARLEAATAAVEKMEGKTESKSRHIHSVSKGGSIDPKNWGNSGGGRTTAVAEKKARRGIGKEDDNTGVEDGALDDASSSTESSSSDGDFDDDDDADRIDMRVGQDADNSAEHLSWIRIVIYCIHVLRNRMGSRTEKHCAARSHVAAAMADGTAKFDMVDRLVDRQKRSKYPTFKKEQMRELFLHISNENLQSLLNPGHYLNKESLNMDMDCGSLSWLWWICGALVDPLVFSRPLLPVPLQQTRLVEFLGSVTFVSFIDDDIVTEGSSITEEVYLLSHKTESEFSSSGALKKGRKRHQNSNSGRHGRVRFTTDVSRREAVVLDLHANRDRNRSDHLKADVSVNATRFESANWWFYLACLKPIGLNAMCTFDSYLNRKPGEIRRTRTKSWSEPHQENHNGNIRVLPSTASSPSVIASSSLSDSVNNLRVMDAALVAHIRNTLPNNTLKDLAQEIGFLDKDIDDHYARLLEINILAPRLAQNQIMEDTHAWGPEDSRSRGKLPMQGHGVIIADIDKSHSTAQQGQSQSPKPDMGLRGTVDSGSIGNSLQLLTQGHPSLLLNYCKEYWDGANIAPMGKADRDDILSIYKRWELEDFHVVAFTYCPVPISHKHLIVSASITGGGSNANNGLNVNDNCELDNKTNTGCGNRSVGTCVGTDTPSGVPLSPVCPLSSGTNPAPAHRNSSHLNRSLKRQSWSSAHEYKAPPNCLYFIDHHATLTHEEDRNGIEGGVAVGGASQFALQESLPKSRMPVIANNGDVSGVAMGKTYGDSVVSKAKELTPVDQSDRNTQSMDGAFIALKKSQELDQKRIDVDENADTTTVVESPTNVGVSSAEKKTKKPSKLKHKSSKSRDKHGTKDSKDSSRRRKHKHKSKRKPAGVNEKSDGSFSSDSSGECGGSRRKANPKSVKNAGIARKRSNSTANPVDDNASDSYTVVQESGGDAPVMQEANLIGSISGTTKTEKVPDDSLLVLQQIGSTAENPVNGSPLAKSRSESVIASSGVENESELILEAANNIIPAVLRIPHANSRALLTTRSHGDVSALVLEDESVVVLGREEECASNVATPGFGYDYESSNASVDDLSKVGQSVVSDAVNMMRNMGRGIASGDGDSDSDNVVDDGVVGMEAYVDNDMLPPLPPTPPTPKHRKYSKLSVDSDIEVNSGRSMSKGSSRATSPSGAIDSGHLEAGVGSDMVESSSSKVDEKTRRNMLKREKKQLRKHKKRHKKDKKKDRKDRKKDMVDSDRDRSKPSSKGQKVLDSELASSCPELDSNHENKEENTAIGYNAGGSINFSHNSCIIGDHNQHNEAPFQIAGQKKCTGKNLSISSAPVAPFVSAVKNGDTGIVYPPPTKFATHRKGADSLLPGLGIDGLGVEMHSIHASNSFPRKKSVSSRSLPPISVGPATLNLVNANSAQQVTGAVMRGATATADIVDTLGGVESDAYRRSLAGSIWPLIRQQIFLGMAASSVAVRSEMPGLRETLTASGIRFVYFSPRNMRRSKPLAHKLGITFDWNCAISLRPLDTVNGGGEENSGLKDGENPTEQNPETSMNPSATAEGVQSPSEGVVLDPHRDISAYADWVVHARMPYGVEEIKNHLKTVDNVPLLVNLYTDATPETVKSMVEVFNDYGEIVCSIGSGSYRSGNCAIFQASHIAISVAMMPAAGALNMNDGCGGGSIPGSVESVFNTFPLFSDTTLCASDMYMLHSLIGIGTVPLLQKPFYAKQHLQKMISKYHCATAALHTESDAVGNSDASDEDNDTFEFTTDTLIEAIRHGRVLLNNMHQALAVSCVFLGSVGVASIVIHALPVVLVPAQSVFMLICFTCIYLPLLLVAHIVAPAAWLKLESLGESQEYSNVPVYYDGWLDVLTTHWESCVAYVVSASGTIARAISGCSWSTQGQAVEKEISSGVGRGYSVMQNTPRKNIYISKPRDESRFYQYLLVRICWVGFSVFVVGYITIACVYDGNSTDDHASDTVGFFGSIPLLLHRLPKFHDNASIGDGLNDVAMKNSLVADLISVQLLLGIMSQSMTMVHRGQTILDLPHPFRCKGYYLISMCIVVIHGTILTVKHVLRSLLYSSNESLGYGDVHYIVYFLIPLLNMIGMLINSIYINSYDFASYRRYQQFLRLEFDTRLGMHSPR